VNNHLGFVEEEENLKTYYGVSTKKNAINKTIKNHNTHLTYSSLIHEMKKNKIHTRDDEK
jgi:hypothetical protein